MSAFDWDCLPDAVPPPPRPHARPGGQDQDAGGQGRGAGAPAIEPGGPPEEWTVVHERVVKRAEPSTRAKVLGLAQQGALLWGVPEVVEGEEWLRVHEEAPQGGEAATAWLLVHGESLGLGQLLRRADFVIREVPGRGRSIFAHRDFEAGETVMREEPFFTRPHPKVVGQRTWTGEWSRDFNRIKEPLCFPGEKPDHREGASKIVASPAMVRNALGFAAANGIVRQQILKLYCPDLDSEHPIVKIAQQVARLCVEHLEECRRLDVVQLQRAILSIEMNIFSGGRCFSMLSRVNHSCVPNVIYIGMTGEWRFKALRPIKAGEELCHSYLGDELLLPTVARRQHLWRSKCFMCDCRRCAADEDPMRQRPCRRCFPKWAPEPAMLRDDAAHEGWVAGQAFERLLFGALRPEYESALHEVPGDAWLPDACWCDQRGKGPYMRCVDGRWQCPACGLLDDDEERLSTERLLARLAEKVFFNPSLTAAIGSFKSAQGNLQMVKVDFVAEVLELARAVWGVLGLQHWAAQWARIVCVDLLVSHLEVCPGFFGTAQTRLLSYLLGALNALWEWMLSLDLAQDPSCFLHARALAVLNVAKHRYTSLDDVGSARLLELNQRVEGCTQQAEILPMKRMVIEGSVSFN